MTKDKSQEIVLEDCFNYVEIQSDYMRNLVVNVLSIIQESLDLDKIDFDSIREGATFSGECAEITGDGDITLDSKMLSQYDDIVAMAILAHEFAHFYLDHYGKHPEGLEFEEEADEQAKKWGFDVDKFRKVCGQDTISF